MPGKRAALTITSSVLLSVAIAGRPATGQGSGVSVPGEYPNPGRFEEAIQRYETADKASPPPTGAIVCVGSSSMRGWAETIRDDLSPLTVIPRGFGGSNMNDVLHFADRIVLAYQPRAIVLYEGDNDIAGGIAPRKIANTFRAFVDTVHGEIPDCRIYFLSIKPSIRRWSLWPEMEKTNLLIEADCERDKRLIFVDVASGMLGEGGNPRKEIFQEDNLHMTRSGYEIWRDVLRPILLEEELRFEEGKAKGEIPWARAGGTTDMADQRQVFIDDALIEEMRGASLRLHEPVSGGVALRIDKPWEGPANAPKAVFEHDGRLLMYYRAMTLNPGDESGMLCVAVSDDGIDWKKPALGLVEYEGRRDTNIVGDEYGNGFMATPWLDTRPGVSADERIKAIASEPVSGEKHTAYKAPDGPKRLVFWGSGDGFRFHRLDPQPVMVSDLENCFDGGNTLFWSEVEHQYVLYYRFRDNFRNVARATSKDLLAWSDSVPMTYGDSPREHLYTNNTVPYFRAPRLYIALAARFMKGRRVVTDAQVHAIGLKTAQGHFYGNDCSDGVLLTSRAGSTRYRRTFMESFIRPGHGAENWTSRTNYPFTGILPYGENRIMFWVNRHYMQDTWHVERLLLRVDGFSSVTAPYAGGTLTTRPFTFGGDALEINYRTGAAGYVRIEIQDAAGHAIPGFALADCVEIIGDEIERVVAWGEGTDVMKLAGQTIRLRFDMKDANLYSFSFRDRTGD